MRQKAMYCVGRAVGFASLAIALVMISLAFAPAAAFKAGAILGLAMCLVLLWFARTAHRRLPKNAETWLLLEAERRPDSDFARRMFAAALEEVYLFFAARIFVVAVTFLAFGMLLSLFGRLAAQ